MAKRKYKVVNKKGYKELSLDDDKDLVTSLLLFGAMAIATHVQYKGIQNTNPEATALLYSRLFAWLTSAGLSVINLRYFIESVIKRVEANSDTNMVDEELEMLKEEESKGMKL